eukprot:gene13611-28908_t
MVTLQMLDNGGNSINQQPNSGTVKRTDFKLRTQHIEFEDGLDPIERDAVRRRRMIYRSKQRGWLEVDLLLGSWAAENVPNLTEDELDQYEVVLEEETINIYKYMSGQEELPPHMAELSLMKKLQNYSFSKSIKTPEEYETLKVTANLT